MVNTSVTDLFPLTDLRTLELEGGDSGILDSVGKLKSLSSLSLRSLQIELDVGENNIQKIVGHIAFTKMRKLDISNNPMEDVDTVSEKFPEAKIEVLEWR